MTVVEREVQRRPWVEQLMRPGWVAKGVVYVLMGVVAMSFVTGDRAAQDDQASPEGALGVVSHQPAGRLLLMVMGVGLILYCLWRVLTVAMVTGSDGSAHVHRAAYAFSALFYGFLAITALGSAMSGSEPEDSYSVERLSTSLLSHGFGRALLLVAGIAVMGIGVYFMVKAVRHDDAENLRGVQPGLQNNHGFERLLYIAGGVGWAGRAVVTALIGFFVARSAWRFDASDASGFDRSLRKALVSDLGTFLVAVAAVGLVVYGVYCILGASRREVEQDASS